ncbi:glycosyltransferase [Plantactinospora sp. S1510]|uniref:Glycosyltransferase n=1 Tax=Plantactinospora alkalitolerans TaxID=2789879 RepID=A0ABS0H8R2_9ACTN|nr:glycosyltransferase [Plantactinospora alkalitolerans]MBF9134860.1 glycosyltransferase [Plantactinospora alkalitolerans]
MSRIGLVCPDYTGHLSPMSTLGRELLRRGHQVTLFSLPDAGPKPYVAGFEFVPFGEREFPPGSLARFSEEQGRLSGLAAIRFIVRAYVREVEVLLRDLPPLLSQHRMDGLLVDQVHGAANTVAERLDIPVVNVCNALALNAEPAVPPFMTSWPYRASPLGRLRNLVGYRVIDRVIGPVVQAVNDRRVEWGMRPVRGFNDGGSDLAQITQQPAFFDFPRRELPDCFHYTGPFHDDGSSEPTSFPWDMLDDRPLIYASMGTLQNRLPRIFHTIASACAGLDAQLVIALGSREMEPPVDLPGRPIVVAYAPQLELLERASLVITHAGINTALESLAHGVPTVAIPVANDQPGVAARLRYLGVGEFVPVHRVNASRLRAAIDKVLDEPAYRTNARRYQRQIAEVDGLGRAADIVEEAFRTRQPVRRGETPLGAGGGRQ